MSKIIRIEALEVLDSRGNPTVEAIVHTDSGSCGAVIVPSGASTGEHEAHELRDRDERYLGAGVRNAVHNIETYIAPALTGMELCSQQLIDRSLLELDGTRN